MDDKKLLLWNRINVILTTIFDIVTQNDSNHPFSNASILFHGQNISLAETVYFVTFSQCSNFVFSFGSHILQFRNRQYCIPITA